MTYESALAGQRSLKARSVLRPGEAGALARSAIRDSKPPQVCGAGGRVLSSLADNAEGKLRLAARRPPSTHSLATADDGGTGISTPAREPRQLSFRQQPWLDLARAALGTTP